MVMLSIGFTIQFFLSRRRDDRYDDCGQQLSSHRDISIDPGSAAAAIGQRGQRLSPQAGAPQASPARQSLGFVSISALLIEETVSFLL